MSIGLRCGKSEEQTEFKAFAKAITTVSELTLRREVNCRSQRRKPTRKESSAAMRKTDGDCTDADRHMQELLNELSVEEMRNPTKSKRKSKKKKTMSASDDRACPPLDASDAGAFSVAADRTQENTAPSPEVSTYDHDMHAVAANVDASSIANSGCDRSNGKDFAEHLLSVYTCTSVGCVEEELGWNGDGSADEWQTACSSKACRKNKQKVVYTCTGVGCVGEEEWGWNGNGSAEEWQTACSSKTCRKNKQKTVVPVEAPAPATLQIIDSISCTTDDQNCASSCLATVEASPAAISNTEETAAPADGRPSAHKELDVGMVTRGKYCSFDCRTEITRIPSEASPAESVCSDAVSPRPQQASEACQPSTSPGTPRSDSMSGGADAPWSCWGQEEGDDALSEGRPSSGSHRDGISKFDTDCGQHAVSQAVRSFAPVASLASLGFGQLCHSTAQKDACGTEQIALGGASKEPSEAEGKMQIAKCPVEDSAQESSQHHHRENWLNNHVISTDLSDKDSTCMGGGSDMTGVVSSARFFAEVDDLHGSLLGWADPSYQLMEFIAPSFVPDGSFGFDAFTSETGSRCTPITPEQSDLSSDSGFPTHCSWGSCLGSPMKVHVAPRLLMEMDCSEPMKVDAVECLGQRSATGMTTSAHSFRRAESLEQGSAAPHFAEWGLTNAPGPPCVSAGSEHLRTALEEEIRCTEAHLLNLRSRLQQLC